MKIMKETYLCEVYIRESTGRIDKGLSKPIPQKDTWINFSILGKIEAGNFYNVEYDYEISIIDNLAKFARRPGFVFYKFDIEKVFKIKNQNKDKDYHKINAEDIVEVKPSSNFPFYVVNKSNVFLKNGQELSNLISDETSKYQYSRQQKTSGIIVEIAGEGKRRFLGPLDSFYDGKELHPFWTTQSDYVAKKTIKLYGIKDVQDFISKDGNPFSIIRYDESDDICIDACSDADLLNDALNRLVKEGKKEKKNTNEKFTKEQKNNLVSSINENKGIFFEGVAPSMREQRLKRVIELLEVLADSSEIEKDLEKIDDNLLKALKDDRTPIIDKELRDELYTNVQQEIEEAKRELEEDNKRLEERKKELEDKNGELEEIQGKLVKTNDDLTQKNGKLTDENERLESQKRAVEEYFENALSRDNIDKKTAELAFDPVFYHKLIDSVGGQALKPQENPQDCQTEVEPDNRFKNAVDEMRRELLSKESIASNTVLDHMLNQFKKRRDYKKDFLCNVFLCINQGFLTIFSGNPGIGKTSFCNIYAKTIGLKDGVNEYNSVKMDRFLQIPVERGWTSKRDLIGYYNPITKSFDNNNSFFYDGLNVMAEEVRDPNELDGQFLVLLDEANLSPMEYYWESFMNICDDISNGIHAKIDLGAGYTFPIYDGLRFVATINNDHTTETLSPRLLDRAWVIRLPKIGKIDDNNLDFLEEVLPNIPWKVLKEQFVPTRKELAEFKFDDALKSIYDDFLSLCSGEKVIVDGNVKEFAKLSDENKENNPAFKLADVSPRVEYAIKMYCAGAQKVEKWLDKKSALDFAIAQRILPHISGYGEQYGENLQKIAEWFKVQGLKQCGEVIDGIVKKGATNRHFYQFFA